MSDFLYKIMNALTVIAIILVALGGLFIMVTGVVLWWIMDIVLIGKFLLSALIIIAGALCFVGSLSMLSAWW